MEVPRPGIEPMPQQWPEPLQQGHQILNTTSGLLLFFFFFLLFRAIPSAYGGSQAKGPIRATAASLYHIYSNARSLTHWTRPGNKPATSWFLVGFGFRCVTTGTPPTLFSMKIFPKITITRTDLFLGLFVSFLNIYYKICLSL